MRNIFLLVFIFIYNISFAQTVKPFVDSERYQKQQNNLLTADVSAPMIPSYNSEPPRFQEKKDIGEGFTAALQDGKWGLFKNEAAVLPFAFDEIGYFSKGYARIKRENQYGLINWQGNIVLETAYEDLSILRNGYLMIQAKGLWGIMGAGNKWAVQPMYQAMTEINKGYFKVKERDKWGILSPTFQRAVPPQYDDLKGEGDITPESFYIIAFQNNKKGLIDYTGKVLIPIIYETCAPAFAKDTFLVIKDGKWGIVNSNHKILLPLIYDKILQRGESRIVVIDNKEGMINEQFELVIPCEYTSIEEFSKRDITIAVKDKKYGFINIKGEVLSEFIYDDALSFFDGLSRVRIGNQRGFVNTKGQLATKGLYDKIEYNNGSEPHYLVRRGLKYGYISIYTAEEKIPVIYDRAGNFKNGKAPVRLGDSLFYINRLGKKISNIEPTERIEFTYDRTGRVYDGLSTASIGNKYGFLNALGHEVIPMQYDYANDFSEGLAAVDKDGKKGFINKSGQLVIPFTFDAKKNDETSQFKHGLAPVAKQGLYALIDTTGKAIIPFKYSAIFPFSEGFALAQIDNRLAGYLNTKGEVAIPFIYTFAGTFQQGRAQVGTKEGSFFINTKGEKIQ